MRRNGAAKAVLAAAALVAGAAALAQTVDDGDAPSSAASLDLPSELTFFGKTDPTVHKATAIVNGAIITDTDIDQRLALAVVANGGRVPEDEKERLRLQTLRNLIDETLEIQEAKANDFTITPREIDGAFARVATNFRKSPADFAAYLKQAGSSERSIKRQIEGELAWQRVLGRRVEPFINVSDDEVKALIARLNASKGATEYHVAEIFLSATPSTNDEVQANANRIAQQLHQGASFVAYARQFSEASTAAVGGDLGWVRAEQLPDALASQLKTMQSSQVSDPIAVSGGYSIIALVEQRQILSADPLDATLALRQLSITFGPNDSQASASPRVAAFATVLKTLKGCGDVEAAAKQVGAEVTDNDAVKVRDLPGSLQQIMLNLSIGQASPPFGSLKDGVRSLVLCGRDDPKAASDPNFDQIQQQITEDRVNRRARRYLRDLRRDAVIEYR